MGLVRSIEADQYVPNTFSGYWEGLSAGTHIVSMWAYSNSGTATNATTDPGGWKSNFVAVTEFLPLGQNYVPLINR